MHAIKNMLKAMSLVTAASLIVLLIPAFAVAQVTNNSSCLDPNYINQINTIHRSWNSNLIDHFYTLNSGETASGYTSEQSTWGTIATQATGTIPFYRYWGNSNTDHFYSQSSSSPGGYVSEGLIGYIFTGTVPGSVPLHRLYRHLPDGNGDHLYTTSDTEKTQAQSSGYNYEGIEGYVCTVQ